MKQKLILFLFITFLINCITLHAQVPESISYQAVVRDANNQLVKHGQPTVRISILAASTSGSEVYKETHQVSTNENGLFSLQIGKGNPVLGNFSTIDWSTGLYFVKMEIALDAINYNLSAVSQLLSVPYALHAKTADKIKGNISFNDLSDVPAGFNFSGDYRDLNNKPHIVDSIRTYGFSGDYEDLKNKPTLGENGFSGSYNDLINKPLFNDSITKYGFSGDYTKLSNLPNLFSGSYNDLSNKPVYNFADSVSRYGIKNYRDLLSLPNFSDSIAKYGFSGDYNDLKNKPTFGENGFSGEYADLVNKPIFKDSVERYGFTGRYFDLQELPSWGDTISQARFSGNYNDLTQLPNIKDSVILHQNKDYRELSNKPNIKDSINSYGFSGNYESLYNTPSIFDGDYNKLSNRPVGTQTGDILYWEDVVENENEASGWRFLPRGAYGMVLTIDENGKPAWINITQLMSFVADAKYDTIYASAGSNGNINPKGKIAVVEGGLAQFTITPNDGYGIDTIYVDSVAISLDNIDRKQPFSYTFSDIDTTHYIHAVFAQKKIHFSILYENVQPNDVFVTVNEQNVTSNSIDVSTAAGGEIPFSIGLASKIGLTIELDNVDITEEVIANGYTFNIPVITDDRQVKIKFKKTARTYAIGDIYPNETNPQGVVIFTKSGGESGSILHLSESEAMWCISDSISANAVDELDGRNNITSIISSNFQRYPAFNAVNINHPGWYIPAINELLLISTNFIKINTGLLKVSGASVLSSGEYYWSSTEKEKDYSWGVIMGERKDYFYKPESLRFRVIKQIDF